MFPFSLWPILRIVAAHVLGFPGGSEANNLSAMKEMPVPSLGPEDALEKGMATQASTLARESLWMEASGRLQSTGSWRVGHD